MKFGQYELLERVAVGGMAEVYRGRVAGAEGFEKWVAIKRILPEFARDERFISMMLTEARIHSALSHRNIVQIHDLGISEDGEYFIVLEYVEGHDLRAVMEAASELGVQIPDSLALHVADELAQALHFAHELTDPDGQPLGIIHRDVSPSNVLISNSGEVKLSDFGIAKRRNDHSFVGSLKGNLVYMSPEQARRVPLDRRTDVFSLGAVLFEMLTGHKVRDITDEVSGFRDVASGVVRSARALRPDLPDAYEQLLAKALASNPADRFQDAAAFGAAIRELGRERDAPVGPSDMKELIELLDPPRRARSPVERSKVIRLGPEFKALAGHPRGGRAASSSDPGGEQPPVILAPGVVPVQAPATDVHGSTTQSGARGSNGQGGSNGSNGSNGKVDGWADGAATNLAPATATPPTPPARKLTPTPFSAMDPTPPPPVVPRPASPGKSAKQIPRFDAVEAALHALEFSAGSDMQPTPPPPAVQGPYAPDVVTPVATPRPVGRLPVERPDEHPVAHVVTPIPLAHAPVDFTATDMAMSMPTPPPRTSTASYPGVNGQSAVASGPGDFAAAADRPRDHLAPAAGALRGSGQFNNNLAPTTAVMPVQRRGRPWLSGLVGVLVILSASAAVVHYKVMPLEVLAVWLKPATLVIGSDPSGAAVTLDGRPLPGQTPSRVEVRRDRLEHLLEFTRPGSRPVRRTVRFDKTVALSESVVLPAEPVPEPPPPPPAQAASPPPEVVALETAPPAEPTTAAPATSKPTTKAARKAARASAASARKAAAKQLAAKKKAKKKAKKQRATKKVADSAASEL